MIKPTLLNQVNVAVTTQPRQVLGPNGRRVGLIFSAPHVYQVSVSFNGPLPFPGGLVLQPGSQPFQLMLANMGDAFQGEVSMASASGVENIGIIELFS